MMNAEIERNVTHELNAHALNRPNHPAIILGDCIINYKELNESIWRTVGWLQKSDIRPGMTVGLLISDQLLMLLGTLGLMRLGATGFPMSPNSPSLQHEHLLQEAGVNVVISDSSSVKIKNFHILKFGQSVIQGDDNDSERNIGPHFAPCLLLSGSGTTGRPRLIPITHSAMIARAKIGQQIYSINVSDRLMVAAQMHFMMAIRWMMAVFSVGGTGIVWDQQGALGQKVMEMEPDILLLTVLHAEKILDDHTKNYPVNFSTIRVVTVGTSTVSKDLRRRMLSDINSKLHVEYGSNESAVISLATPQDVLSVPGSVGKPPIGVQVQVVNDNDQQLGIGQIGHVRVKSACQIAGYHRSDSNERFRDGWFYPGDLAKWSQDGHLFHCGRADQMMIMNGINIYPAEIERILEQHPFVREAVAFPIKHPIAQEIPVCVVVLKPHTKASQDELETFSRQRLGARTPRAIAIIDSIPRNEQGKPHRTELLRLFLVSLDQSNNQEMTLLGKTAIKNRGNPQPPEPPLPQPKRRIHLDFLPPHILQVNALDAWLPILNPVFRDSLKLPSPAEATTLDKQIAEWLKRTMVVTQELLQVAAIPLFERPEILTCRPLGAERKDWRAALELHVVEHVPEQVFKIAFAAAVRATRWMMTQEPTAINREKLFQLLKREAIEPIKQLTSFGKSTLPILKAAYDNGIPFRSLGGGVYQLGLGAKGHLTDRSSSDRDSAIGVKLAHNKALAAHALRLAGLPAPVHEVVNQVSEARAVADRLGWPVVLKPADLDRGEGVSVDVDASSLGVAFDLAYRLARTKQVIVERQVEGVCHRLFVASGKLLYAVKRLPIGVYGDGALSIEELVEFALAEQQKLPPWRRSKLRPIDDLARTAIATSGLQVTSVPDAGRFVPLRRIESTAWGGVDEEVTNRVHPENLRVAIEASELLRLDVAGIDLITPDISEPWHVNGAIINEVNSVPLLGGGEISRKYIDEYLTRLLDGKGRIPVEAFLGGEDAWIKALDRRKEMGGNGTGIFVTSTRRSLNSNGYELVSTFSSLHHRTRALLLSRQVRALLIVVQDDELLSTGLPVEYFNRIHDAGGSLRQHQNPELLLVKERDQMLRRLLMNNVRLN
jgi:acyl-CoA synthetase (AMP-forming)/AMP-acid ligase II/D-alanine-D-alanine ligase-like ATP-grasp enzyme